MFSLFPLYRSIFNRPIHTQNQMTNISSNLTIQASLLLLANYIAFVFGSQLESWVCGRWVPLCIQVSLWCWFHTSRLLYAWLSWTSVFFNCMHLDRTLELSFVWLTFAYVLSWISEFSSMCFVDNLVLYSDELQLDGKILCANISFLSWFSLKYLIIFLLSLFSTTFYAPNSFLYLIDCLRNDWTSRDGYCTSYFKANQRDGCHETGATWKIFAARASTCSDLLWSTWGQNHTLKNWLNFVIFF